MMAFEGDRNSLCRRIYYAAREGMAITLFALLSDVVKKDHNRYLECLIEEDGQKCTPLVIACLNGRDNVVRMLIKHFRVNLEQECTVQLHGYAIEGATALWCAAGVGQFYIVKTLIESGADVNHSTRTKSTPLRAACFEGRLDVVRLLVENGADVHAANNYNNTCLMIASYRGHLDIVSYLLSKGADPDARALCGATALHFASENGHLEIVKTLLKNNAKILKNIIGMTPLLSAAERTISEVVEYLINESWCSKQECIEALELLGASYANDKDNYNLEKTYYYLEWAMKERAKYPELCPPKVHMAPIPAYDNRIECENLNDLQAIRYNINALHMESLVIRERILGSNNPEVIQPIIFRGAVFADLGYFDRSIDLWLHALYLRRNQEMPLRKDLLRFAQVFAQMLHIGLDLPYDYLKQVLEVTYFELERNKSALLQSSNEICEALYEEFEDNIHTMLYLLVIVSKLVKKYSKEEEYYLCKLIYQIIKLDLATSNGSSPLHLVVNTNTPVDEFHTKFICKFPCASTVRLLIQCGADVNAVDKVGNTPLHIIVAYQKPITDFMILHSIITQLLDAGAHIDCVNNMGETPSEAVLTGVADIILKSQFNINLKCLSAKAIRKYNIPYRDILPLTLVAFTDMHGVPCKKKV